MGRLTRWLIGPSEAEIRAAAPVPRVSPAPRLTPSVALPPNGWGTGIQRLAPASMTFAPPLTIWSRYAAMQIPAVSRSRNLLCSAVGALPLTLWRFNANPDPSQPPVEAQLPPASWMIRPDPFKTRNHILAWTADDLFFHGRAYWLTVTRYANTFPATFVRMPAEQVSVHQEGTVKWGNIDVEPRDVVEFLSPNDGILYTGWYAIETAMNLDAAANRFSQNNVPQGWLKQTGGEPMGSDELVALATGWDAQRSINATGALNTDVDYHESTYDPQRLQLTEARQHQALELSRVTNVPAYLLGANTGRGTGMTYSNAIQSKQDLIDFGAAPLINCIEQTLSSDAVLPHGQFCRLDLEVYLRNPFTPGSPHANDAQIAVNDPTKQPTDVANGRPRQADGRNAAQGVPA